MTCEPAHAICCLQVEHSGWSVDAAILLRPSAGALWDTADTCPLDGVATEICGAMEDHWHMPWRDEGCLPRISLSWRPIAGDCDRIALTLKMRWQDTTGVLAMSEVTIEENRSWYTRDIVFDDPLYPVLHSRFPDFYADGPYTITIRVCPEDYTAFPEPEAAVVLQVVPQKLNEGTGEWADVELGEWPEWTSGIACGNCVCGSPARGSGSSSMYWVYDPYRDEVRIFSSRGAFTPVLVPYEACAWPDSEIFSYYPGATPEDDPLYRVRIQRLDIECPTGVIDPVDPPLYCKKKTLCALLSVDDGESYSYYSLIWNAATARYELAASPVPGGKLYTIEIILEEDTTTSPGGLREWVLTVTIKDLSSVVILEYTETYSIDCESEWSKTSTLEVPITPPEDWTLTIATTCPDTPPPPPCDPGCWPECVMCPERKTLYAVVSDAPDCCLSGAYALTWVGTGGGGAPTVGYYELSAPVGGPIDTCGQITFLRVYCVDSTHITVHLVYLRAEGTEISNLSSPATLSVICDESGNLESDAINVPGRSGGRESLCGFGSGVGGDIRIVST